MDRITPILRIVDRSQWIVHQKIISVNPRVSGRDSYDEKSVFRILEYMRSGDKKIPHNKIAVVTAAVMFKSRRSFFPLIEFSSVLRLNSLIGRQNPSAIQTKTCN